VTESTGAGLSIGALSGVRTRADAIAYKLFEIVEGAVLEVKAPAGSRVVASITLETPRGRRFEYRAAGDADAEGVVRLRLPYSTSDSTPVETAGSYRLRVEGRTYRLKVSEAAVQAGGKLVLDATS